jgi:hypothetical protein
VSKPTNPNLCNKSNVIQSYKWGGGGGFSAAAAAKLSTAVVFGLEQVAKTRTMRMIATAIVIGIRGLKENFCFIFWKIIQPFGIGKMIVLLQH